MGTKQRHVNHLGGMKAFHSEYPPAKGDAFLKSSYYELAAKKLTTIDGPP